MKYFLNIIFIFFSIFFIYSTPITNEEQIFKKGIEFYNNNNFIEAKDKFIEILNMGYDNFNLNFNLGCCYYKLNKYGYARYYFEKALVYNPFNKDLENNLKLLYSNLSNNPSELEQEILSKRIIFFIPHSFLFISIISLLLIIIILFLFFINSNKLKKIFLILLSFSVIFIIILTFIFSIQYFEYSKKQFYIINPNENVYLAPMNDTNIIVTLQEGTKGVITEDIGLYIKINLSDGSSGWLKKENVIVNY